MKDTERKNITQPITWWAEFEKQAKAEGIPLSEWIGACCFANLPQDTQDRLPERKPRGREWGTKLS